MSQRQGNGFMRLWGAPLLLAVLTLIGLVSALTGDGGLHYWVSWLLLGLPVLLCAWYAWRPQRGRRR